MMRVLIIIVLLGAFVTPASAHSWYTSTGCCGGKDCRAVELGELKFTVREDGTPVWLVVKTGEMIPASQTRQSPDEQNHRCEYLDGYTKGKTRWTGYGKETLFCLWIVNGT